MLQAARRRLRDAANVELRRGELEALPIDDGELDAATLMLVLHHLPDPAAVLAEAHRVLKPGGRLLICDMLPHDREEYRQQMGHVWLGFGEDQIRRLLANAGFEKVRVVAAAGGRGGEGAGAVRRHGDEDVEAQGQSQRLVGPSCRESATASWLTGSWHRREQMTTAVREMHAFDAAVKAGREPFKVKDLSLAEFGRKEIRLAEQEMPGLMALRARYQGKQPARRREDHGQPAHDDSDRGPDRDARRARRRRALGVVQHLLDPGSRRRRGRRRPSRDRRHRRRIRSGTPVFAWKGETLEEYWWCTSEALMWPDGSGPTLIVDDGGDATLLRAQGR